MKGVSGKITSAQENRRPRRRLQGLRFGARLLLLLALLVAAFPSRPARAAGTEGKKYRFYADLRYRLEYQDNFNAKYYGAEPPAGAGSDTFMLQRLRLGLHYQFSENLEVALGIQDSRAWGVSLADEVFYKKNLGLINHPYEDYTEPYETYIKLKDPAGLGLTLTAGRQSISFGDNRIFGPGQWGNTGRYHWDALRLSWVRGPNRIDLLWGAHIIHEPETISLGHRHNHYGAALYSHFEVDPRLVVEPFFVNKYDRHDNYQGESGVGDHNSWFVGVRLYGGWPAGFYYDLTGVREWGDYGADDIRAWGGHLKAGWRFAELFWQPDLSLEFSYASGDGDPDDGSRRTFTGVFGARDKMYGRINLFDWQNLKDYQLNLLLKPWQNLSLLAEAHDFRLADVRDGWSLNSRLYRDPTGAAGDRVGRELDLIATLKLKPGFGALADQLTVMVGACRFWPGSFTEKIASGKNADWLFLQLHYRVEFWSFGSFGDVSKTYPPCYGCSCCD